MRKVRYLERLIINLIPIRFIRKDAGLVIEKGQVVGVKKEGF